MDLREALLLMADHVRFPEEQQKLDVVAAINETLSVPEPLDIEGEFTADETESDNS